MAEYNIREGVERGILKVKDWTIARALVKKPLRHRHIKSINLNIQIIIKSVCTKSSYL